MLDKKQKSDLCAVFSKTNREDPGGSAPNWNRALFIEMDTPWKSDVADSNHFPSEISDAIARTEKSGKPVRLQCIVPDTDYSVLGKTRLMLFTRPSGPFSTYTKTEYVIHPSELGPLTNALLNDTDKLHLFNEYLGKSESIRDIFVCTQGTRDVCCASFGIPVFNALRNDYATKSYGQLRVWRTSHMGGHRLAPNLLDMPEGRNWVRVDLKDLENLVYRTSPASALQPNYRGSIAISTPQEQIAERAVFMKEDWDWTRYNINTKLIESTNEPVHTVRVDFQNPADKQSGSYLAMVEPTKSVPSIDCRIPGQTGEIDQFRIVELTKI